jgi:ferredoxin
MSPEAKTATRVSIDSSLCAGHGRCYEIAPSLFQPDDDGYGQVIEPMVTGDDRALAERVAGLCPELAVRISDEASGGSS